MALWGDLFQTETKAVARQEQPSSPAVHRVTGASSLYSAYNTDDIDAMMRHYERVIWVYRCVDVIASNQAKLAMTVLDDNDKPVDKKYPDLMKLLNKRPNFYETAHQFRYRVSTIAQLSSQGVFIEVTPDDDGGVKYLHILKPGSVTPVPHETKFVEKYQVRTAHGLEELATDRVIWIKLKPHPTDPYRQVTPLVSAGLASDTDFLARVFNRNFLANDSRPGLVVGVKPTNQTTVLSPEDRIELKRRFTSGRAGETAVVEAALDLIDLGINPRDVQWAEALAGSKQDLMLAFGVPESQLGNASGRTFDNADAEEEMFWKITMTGHCDGVASGFDQLTRAGGDPLADDHRLRHDYTGIDVLQRVRREKEAKWLDEVKSGVRTIDSYLEMTGQKPLQLAGTRVLWYPAGNLPFGTDEDVEALKKLTPAGEALPEDPAASAQAGAYEGITEGIRRAQNNNAARDLRLRAAADPRASAQETKRQDDAGTPGIIEAKVIRYAMDYATAEGGITGICSAWSKRLIKRTAARVTDHRARKGTRHWEAKAGEELIVTKALDVDYVISGDSWLEELADDLEHTIFGTADQLARKVIDEINMHGVEDQGIRQLTDEVVGVATASANRQLVKLANLVAQADADPDNSIEDIKRKIQDFGDTLVAWHRNLSKSLATSVVEGTKHLVYKNAEEQGHGGLVWQSQDDDTVRPTHWAVDGHKAIDGYFHVGSAYLRFPGDPQGPADEVAGCRCTLVYRPR